MLNFKDIFREILHLLLLYTFALISVYYLPTIANYFFFFVVLLLFSISKKNYFWLAFFVTIFYSPFGFFSEATREATHRLPLISFGAGLSFSYQLIFLIVGLIKAYTLGKKVNSYFKKHYIVLLIYLIILIIISVFGRQTQISYVFDGVKNSIFLLYAYTLFRLIIKRKDKIMFFNLLFPFSFLFLLDAIYFLLTGGDYIYNIVSSQDIKRIAGLGIDSSFGVNARYIIDGFYFSYITFIISLALINISRYKKYLLIISLSSFIVVIAGALRSWFVIYSLSFIAYLLFNSKRVGNIVGISLISIILIIPILSSSIGSSTLGGAFERISTVFSLGDDNSASTRTVDHKLLVRLPKQLEYIKQSPFFGWGYTEIKGDGDVGNIALIVDAGIFGFAIFIWFLISYFSYLIQEIRNIRDNNAKNSLRILIVLTLGILLSHFTTNQMFSIYEGVFVSLLVFFAEFLVNEVRENSQMI